MEYWQDGTEEVKQRVLDWITTQITNLLVDMETMPSRKVTCYMRGKADAYDMARCMIKNMNNIKYANRTLNLYKCGAQTYATDYDGTPRIMRIMYRGKMAAFQSVMDWLARYQDDTPEKEPDHD